jgi:DNA-binding transcriptional LysR family regulator
MSSYRQLHYTLRQLGYFVVTAEVLSFTAASKLLHISQPSISTALAELESSFGVQLFVRHHAAGLSLTQAGRKLLGLARSLLKNAEDLQTAAHELNSGMSGVITLGCLASLAPPVLPTILARFIAEHENVGFDTREVSQEELLRGLRDGSLDLALTYDLALIDEIEFTPLVELRPYVILPKLHKLARAGTVSLASLVDEPYVMLDLPYSREYFASLFDSVGRRPVPAFHSSQPEVVRGMVANGLGYSILNFPLKSTQTVDGSEFTIRPFKEQLRPLTLGIARLASVQPRRIVQRFAQFCAATISGPARRAGHNFLSDSYQ